MSLFRQVSMSLTVKASVRHAVPQESPLKRVSARGSQFLCALSFDGKGAFVSRLGNRDSRGYAFGRDIHDMMTLSCLRRISFLRHSKCMLSFQMTMFKANDNPLSIPDRTEQDTWNHSQHQSFFSFTATERTQR